MDGKGDHLVLTLPLTKPLLSSNDQRRAHWTTVRDAKATVELLVHQAIKKARAKPMEGPVSVRLVWYVPTAHPRDPDSLAPTAKACLDALVQKGILTDDSFKHVYDVRLGPIVVSRDNPRMELIVRRLAEVGGVCPGGPGIVLP